MLQPSIPLFSPLLAKPFKPLTFGASASPKIMLTLDVDGTLLPESVNIEAFQRSEVFKTLQGILKNYQNWWVLFINTGRKFSELPPIFPLLMALNAEIYGIAMRDGKEMIWKPHGQTTKQWLTNLQSQTSPQLAKQYTHFIWEAPLKSVKNILAQEGYRHIRNVTDQYQGTYQVWENPNRPQVTVQWKADETYFQVYAEDRSLRRETVKALSNSLGRQLGVPEFSMIIANHGAYDDIYIPVINKKMAADYAKTELSKKFNIFAEVRAGDGQNDSEMLTDPKIYAIQVGNNHKLQSLKNTRVKAALPFVKEETLAAALQKQLVNIQLNHAEHRLHTLA